MPIVIYPPNLPLHEDVVMHNRDLESRWASPIQFVPFLLLTTAIFLAGLWAIAEAPSWEMFANLPVQLALLIVSLVPPFVLVAAILIAPHLSSPAFAYQIALLQDDSEHQIRWNLAVVTTAHIYCGRVAQVEWINLMQHLSREDRLLALGFVRRVRSRLQQIPVLSASDWIIALIVSVSAPLINIYFFGAKPFEAVFNALALLIMVQLFMLYLYTQRWQHIRRLMELEDVFEELLPLAKPAATDEEEETPKFEDEVTRWAKENEVPTNQRRSRYQPPSASDTPPVPWE